MRIAQVVSQQESVPPKYQNGLEFIASEITEGLVKRGHQVTLFAPANSKTKAKLMPIYPFGVVNEKNKYRLSGIHYSRWALLKSFEMASQFDIIHAHVGSLASDFAQLIKTPVIQTVHSPVNPIYKKLYNSKIHKKYFKEAYSRWEKSYRIYVSKKQQATLPRKKNTFVVHNGINVDAFKFNASPQDYFCYLGFINEKKGAHIAIQAAKKTGVKLKLAGNVAPVKTFFNQEIKPYLSKNIEYLGPLGFKKKSKLLRNAKAILVPIQWEEPFGLIMPEAMASGTPVIGFNKGAVPEIVKNGKTGFVVKDVNEMVKAIKKIDQIDRHGCYKYAHKYFAADRMVDEYEKIYKKIIYGKK